MMEVKTTPLLPNPEESASFFARYFTYGWLNNLFKLGNKRPLRNEDLFQALQEDESRTLIVRLERLWQEEQRKAKAGGRRPKLFQTLMLFLGMDYVLLGLPLIIEHGINVAQPYFIGRLIGYFVPGATMSKVEAYILGTILVICTFIMAWLRHPILNSLTRHGMHLRVACSSLVYKKILQFPYSSNSNNMTRHILNLATRDVLILEKVTLLLHQFWIAPLVLLATGVLSWFELGLWSLPGIACICFLVILHILTGRLLTNFRHKEGLHTDRRFGIMSKVMSEMRAIKMNTWEHLYTSLIFDIRSQEVGAIRCSSYIGSLNATFRALCPAITGIAMFVPYVLTGNTLTPGKVFTVIGLFYSIRTSLLVFFPECIEHFKESVAYSKRLQNFLEKECKTEGGPAVAVDAPESKRATVIAEKICTNSQNSLSLKDVSFQLKMGNLFMVTGPSCAGKSSLLMCLLGELPLTSGTVNVQGRVSYAPQKTWIFPGSVRENILFGQQYDESKYKRVIMACALEMDLASFPKGDATVVGDRCGTLSESRRAKINLARAVYSDADILLLDDPLISLDTNVGQQVFDECICGLLKDRICVLVTQQLQYLKRASCILCLQEGRCIAKGTYSEHEAEILSIMPATQDGDHDNVIHPDAINFQQDQSKTATRSGHVSAPPAPRDQTSLARVMMVDAVYEGNDVKAEQSLNAAPSWSVYREYLKACGGVRTKVGILFFLLGSQALIMVGEWWLCKWTDRQFVEAYIQSNINSTPPPTTNNTEITYAWVYGAFVASSVVANLISGVAFYWFLLNVSKKFHDNMLSRVLRAPLYFFDTSLAGQGVERFVNDIKQMENPLVDSLFFFLTLSILTFAILLLNVASMPFLLVGAIPMTVLFGYIRNYYLRTSREVKRLEAINRSPVYSHLSTSLTGLITIRAFQAEQAFIRSYHAYTDFHTGAYALNLGIQRWLGIRLDIISALFFALAVFTSLLTVEAGFTISASVVGLCLTYATQLTGMFQWCIRQSAEVENNIKSVKRVMEYSQVEPEPESSEPLELPPTWPKYGILTAERLSYSHHKTLPRVLRNMNFCIKGGEKVGIVGRNGLEKSSLLAALLRLNTPEGIVRIDGLPITDLQLQDLRRRISVIPQDPVLFSGCLRKNVDPFAQFSDDALWNGLEEVHLRETVDKLPDGIETELAEKGSNFSVGQRQLVCLARAILSHNKILVIDEATANVDHSTDSLIKETIRNKFHDCTVLTIAHRLNTVMDSDRVMVLDAGRLVEFDEPYVLLLNSQGFFSQLVEQTGEKTAASLRESARQAYELRHDCNSDEIAENYRKFHGIVETSKEETEEEHAAPEADERRSLAASEILSVDDDEPLIPPGKSDDINITIL
ncbi:ATP-binding cassette sub-family C member 4 [Nematostella vectensis]|uniref:ATP-binding cassette sub-family C member 4 n=1 Tax=Nematostella vectensis TaxID=45351 RepID=UPI00207774B5|nr:ATP-binding cassette sub-family C member 4 [Nematostella vectensis]